jgi:PAS domain S-box-containing protein
LSEEKPIPDLPADLRQRAEEVLERQPGALGEMQPDDIQHLIHELQVHQIELELQNEELRRTQRELEASRDRYADLYDLAPMGYFTLSEKGLILGANLKGASMLGVERVSLIKRPLTQFINREDQDTFYLCRRQLFETQAPQVLEIRLLRNDKSQFWARIEAIPAQSGTGDGIVCRATVSDITELLRAKQQIEAALAEKEVLLKEVHHRVLNNLQALVYLIDTRAEKVVDPEVHHVLATIVGQIKSLAQVHKRLYQSKDSVQIEISEYLEELAINLLQALGGGREISLYVDAAKNFVNEDIALVCGRLVNELVTNALKYAFPGDWQGDRVIRVAFRAREGDYVLIVSDNGVGLPPGFDWRATKTMGLTLVDIWVTRQLEGSIELDSHMGTTFKMSFPAPKNKS